MLKYAPGDDLHSHLQQQRLQQQHQRNGRFDEVTVAQYILQVVEALRYMHYKKLAHRDVTPENILLDSNDNVKLAGFGFSELCEPGQSSRKCGMVGYLSPEMADAYLAPEDWDEIYVGAVDQWIFSVLLYVELADANGETLTQPHKEGRCLDMLHL